MEIYNSTMRVFNLFDAFDYVKKLIFEERWIKRKHDKTAFSGFSKKFFKNFLWFYNTGRNMYR